MTTDAVATQSEEPPDDVPARDETPSQRLARHVTARVIRLQQGYLADTAAAVASLARLRRAVTAEPGSDPGVWYDTFDGFPASLVGAGDAPSAAERAAHAAITLFAVHQQSRNEPMHRKGVSLGAAVRALSPDGSNDDPVLRRFHTLGTAASLPETLHHLRGLVTQFRGASIGLDYGRLAVDLYMLQDPRRAPDVRRLWGRAYYRSRTALAESGDSKTTSTTETPGDQR